MKSATPGFDPHQRRKFQGSIGTTSQSHNFGRHFLDLQCHFDLLLQCARRKESLDVRFMTRNDFASVRSNGSHLLFDTGQNGEIFGERRTGYPDNSGSVQSLVRGSDTSGGDEIRIDFFVASLPTGLEVCCGVFPPGFPIITPKK